MLALQSSSSRTQKLGREESRDDDDELFLVFSSTPGSEGRADLKISGERSESRGELIPVSCLSSRYQWEACSVCVIFILTRQTPKASNSSQDNSRDH